MRGIGIDWGTTNLRAFCFNDDIIINDVESAHGVRQLPAGGFVAAFENITKTFPVDAPVFLYGMVGANTGWREMKYVECPCNVQSFSHQLTDVTDLVGRAAWMAPGLRSERNGFVELIRGEEIQIWGALSLYPEAEHVLLPGTHSKLVRIKNSQIQSFETAMTGELYHLMRTHSILNNDAPQRFNKEQWDAGVIKCRSERHLLTLLFQTRSLMLNGQIAPEHTDSFLSGLLIGSELKRLELSKPLYVIGEDALVDRYKDALRLLEKTVEFITIPPVFAGHQGLLSLKENL